VTTRTLSPLTLEPAAARAYLLCMAEALRKSVAPEVQGDSAQRVSECVSLMLRMAQEISPGEKVAACLSVLNRSPPPGDGAGRMEIALLEAHVLAAADADLRSAEGCINESASAPCHFDSAAFETYLRSHARGGRDVRNVRARLLSGGRGKITSRSLRDDRRHDSRHASGVHGGGCPAALGPADLARTVRGHAAVSRLTAQPAGSLNRHSSDCLCHFYVMV